MVFFLSESSVVVSLPELPPDSSSSHVVASFESTERSDSLRSLPIVDCKENVMYNVLFYLYRYHKPFKMLFDSLPV